MKLIGRLLLVASMLTTMSVVAGTGVASAGTSEVAFPQLSCSTTIVAFGFTVSANYDIDVAITADDSVEQGNAASFSVTVSGLTNGAFADFNDGKAQLRLAVGATEIVTDPVELANVPKNGSIVIPVMEGTTAPLTETTEISVVRVRYWNSAADSWCTFPAASRASVAVLVEGGGSELPQTKTEVLASPQPATFGDTLTLDATVGVEGTPVGSGTVEFFDGVGASAPSLGSAAVSAGGASISGVALGAGSHSVVAKYSGTAELAPSQGVHTFTVAKAGQSIDFAALPDADLEDSSVALAATATSGLAVGFAAAGACTVSGSTLELTGAGSCQVTASQPGNDDYLAAQDVVRTFAITEGADPGDGGTDGGDGEGTATAEQKSITAAVPYRCVISFPSLDNDLVSDQTLTVKLTAPDRATIGSTYKVFMDVNPGIHTDAEIPAGAIEGMKTHINVSAPGTPSDWVSEHPTNSATIPSGGTVTVPRTTGTITAGGKEGDAVKITPGVILVPTKAQTPGAEGGSVTCTPGGNASISPG